MSKSMVTKREKIDHEGLIISIVPIEEKPFYLTGKTPSFKGVIENPSSEERRTGKLFFRWRLGDVHTIREVEFELEPQSKREYEIPKEWLYCEGTAIYELLLIDIKRGPEQPFERYSVHPLCSYYVRDKDLYEYEESYRRTMRHYSRVTIGLTIVIIGLTIVNLISLYGPQLIGLIKVVLNCQ